MAATLRAHDLRLTPWPRSEMPEFHLQDVDRRPRTLAAYRGRVVVVFFGFTHCPDVCPAELFKLAQAVSRIGPLRRRVRVLFITLDPARDTRQLLRRYLAAFDADFVGLTGTPGQIDRAAEAFYVQFARVGSGAGYTIDHSTSTFVLDPAGRLRLVATPKTSIEDIAHDLRALAAQ